MKNLFNCCSEAGCACEFEAEETAETTEKPAQQSDKK